MASLTSLRAEGVSDQKYTTENSTHMTRPGLKTFLQPDTNSGPTDVTHFNEKTDYLKQHVPTATGTPAYDNSCCDAKADAAPLSSNPKKLHSLTLMDPITGMVSAAGEVFCNSGQYTLPTFGKRRTEPQCIVPQNVESLRSHPAAIAELR
jgi:hypothetical protein